MRFATILSAALVVVPLAQASPVAEPEPAVHTERTADHLRRNPEPTQAGHVHHAVAAGKREPAAITPAPVAI